MLPPLLRAVRLGASLAALLVLTHVGCGPSPRRDEATPDGRSADQKKIQELSKKGYNFKDIRSIMSGEEPEPKAGKKTGRGRR